MSENSLKKLGYLHENYRLFHLRDTAGQERELHYHEFAKIVIFLSGHVDYLVEGTSYPLQPWDILLIDSHISHKALIDTSQIYERIILYVDPSFVSSAGHRDDLMECFRKARERSFYLMRPTSRSQVLLRDCLKHLEEENADSEFGAEILQNGAILQLLVMLNRMMLTDRTAEHVPGLVYDPRIADVIGYVSTHLEEELSVEALSKRIYMSKYHFMRLFKEMTGCTVHTYINQKRLLRAAELLKEGESASAVCEKCGFHDYSAFLRSFKAMFGVTPGSYPIR